MPVFAEHLVDMGQGIYTVADRRWLQFAYSFSHTAATAHQCQGCVCRGTGRGLHSRAVVQASVAAHSQLLVLVCVIQRIFQGYDRACRFTLCSGWLVPL
jgi:hypothetical protein